MPTYICICRSMHAHIHTRTAEKDKDIKREKKNHREIVLLDTVMRSCSPKMVQVQMAQVRTPWQKWHKWELAQRKVTSTFTWDTIITNVVWHTANTVSCTQVGDWPHESIQLHAAFSPGQTGRKIVFMYCRSVLQGLQNTRYLMAISQHFQHTFLLTP